MFLYLVFLFTVIPAVELYLLFTVGQKIGVIETIWVILVTGVVGAWLAKAQGRMLLSEVQRELTSGAVPADKLLQGLLVLIGGLLLITPGFMTDIFGIFMVLPITRIPFAFFLKRIFVKMVQSGAIKFGKMGNTTGGFHYQSGGFGRASSKVDFEVERDVTPAQVIDISSVRKSRKKPDTE